MDQITCINISASDYEKLWKRTDWIFKELIKYPNILERPIDLRFPFIFYMGHLASFNWSIINNYEYSKCKDEKVF